jgi:hypothetical protein
MQRRLKVAALLTCCLVLSAGACEKRVATAIPIPPERIDCAVLGGEEARPTIPPEYVIDWTRVTSVQQARGEHDAFVTRLRARETPVALYIVRLEGQLFACADDAAWVRDYQSRLPAP